MELREEFERCFAGLAAIGRHPAGGWTRLAWTDEDRAARGWFAAEAAARGLDVEQDRAGNLWAWWGGRGPDALAVGSHLDTVPRGGAFDGALGVVGGLVAVGALARGGAAPRRPVAVVAFADEEGGRFGMATFGSRVLAGTGWTRSSYPRRPGTTPASWPPPCPARCCSSATPPG